MRVEYDHYSKQCPSYPTPPIHQEDKETLLHRICTTVQWMQDSTRKEEEGKQKEKARAEASEVRAVR